MTARLSFAIVGCGGMGWRHVHGLAELNEASRRAQLPQPLSLSAVVDVAPARAAALADEAERRFGLRPRTYTDLAGLHRDGVCEAVDLNTATESHHTLGIEAFGLGFHVLVEKPLAASIRSATLMIDAAARASRVLSVAENVRREPVNRFARALINASVIGDIRFVLDQNFNGADAIWLTPWRHLRKTGGLLLDVGVHNADVLEFLAGRVHSVTAHMRQDEPQRRRAERSPVASAAMYEAWATELPARFGGDAEDVAFGMLQFENGASGQWTIHLAAHGKPRSMRTIFGSRGSLDLPRDRSGDSIVLTVDGETLCEEQALECAVGFQLAPIESAVWGGDRVTHVAADFATTDRKLVAIELADFSDAVMNHQSPEVDGVRGRRNMALLYALTESGLAHAPMCVDDVESGGVHGYQNVIDADLFM